MESLISEMVRLASRGESFVLATVILSNGSVPRVAGAKMLVRADGATFGTVGGGILEAQVERLADFVLRDHTARVQRFQFSGKDAAAMDAICGGEVEVLVEWWDAADPEAVLIARELQVAAEAHHRAWLATTLPVAGTELRRALVHADGRVTGAQPLGRAVDEILELSQPALMEINARQWLVEPLNTGGTVYIFGAGHVSRSLAAFTHAVGFWTVVLDDRPDYASAERFPTADRLVVLDSFDCAFEQIEVDRESFIVIVTRGHLHDRTVLAQALRTGAGYIGMIGSRRKCALVFSELRCQGFSDEDLSCVHAPIGLPIAAETPEEIGISITAELIQERARLAKK